MRVTLVKTKEKGVAGSKRFQLDCFPFIFSIEELEVLQKKGHIMKALADEKRLPVSEEERMFVKVCKGQAIPVSTMETAWVKYLNRQKNEAALMQTEELYREYQRNRKQ